MPRKKYTEANVPSNIRVSVRYIKDQRWFSSCYLFEIDTGLMVASGFATCSYKDQPVRKIGRAMAIGRALKQYDHLLAGL